MNFFKQKIKFFSKIEKNDVLKIKVQICYGSKLKTVGDKAKRQIGITVKTGYISRGIKDQSIKVARRDQDKRS